MCAIKLRANNKVNATTRLASGPDVELRPSAVVALSWARRLCRLRGRCGFSLLRWAELRPNIIPLFRASIKPRDELWTRWEIVRLLAPSDEQLILFACEHLEEIEAKFGWSRLR